MATHAAPSVYQSTQCVFTAGTIEPGQLQARRRPITEFHRKEFINRVDIISGNDNWSPALAQLIQDTTPPKYYKVKAKLCQIFENKFYLEHVKTGNVSMLSEGSTVSGNVFSLCRGNLKLYLDRETYERSGLSGKLDERSGNREMQSRWFVTYNLQDPAMLHGKRGFDRLVYACKNMSSTSLNWICTLDDSSETHTAFDQFLHTKVALMASTSAAIKTNHIISTLMPDFLADASASHQAEAATELYEWLSLARLDSPRIHLDDNIDPYLSRYRSPEGPPGQMELSCTSWDGLLSSSWVSSLASTLLATCPTESWFAISVTDMPAGGLGGTSEVTVLKPPGYSRYLMWNIKHNR